LPTRAFDVFAVAATPSSEHHLRSRDCFFAVAHEQGRDAERVRPGPRGVSSVNEVTVAALAFLDRFEEREEHGEA
jgi:hypothetical protein